MALPSGTSILAFGGGVELTDGSNSAVANDAKSVQGDLSTASPIWTNTQNAATASFKLVCGFSFAPTVNSRVSIYARLMNVDGASDEPMPDATFNGRFIGAFNVDEATASAPHIAVDVPLPAWGDASEMEFYIGNNTGQTISANWRLYIDPNGFNTAA
jgi:hypothetical protein